MSVNKYLFLEVVIILESIEIIVMCLLKAHVHVKGDFDL